MTLKALFCAMLVLCASCVAALDFSKSKWIWKHYNYNVPPHELADFRYDLRTSGARAVSAKILIAADNEYVLWVNGEYIGEGNDWTKGQRYCVTLQPHHNVFAVQVENLPPVSPAAFISAIEVTFSNGRTKVIKTDSSWRAHDATKGFQKVGFDDSRWRHAVELGSVNSSPWHTPTTPSPPSSLSLVNSDWIWTDEVKSPGGNAPVGSRAFRRTLTLRGGAYATGGTIIIDADNRYTVYVNGKQVGNFHDWTHAQRLSFHLKPTSEIVIAVKATNDGGPAGLIVAAEFHVETPKYCSTYVVDVTDGSWKFAYSVPIGFQEPGYVEHNWHHAYVQGPYGIAPWGSVPTS
ncbi:hypothetical protein APHAL10511_004692 [Amanita phalloides]|nr:hypothetical protein APHAL10511_004692 [Amanita phalloides]